MAAEQITVETKIIQSDNKTIPHNLAELGAKKSIDLLSAPSVITKSGQQAQVEVVGRHQPASVVPGGFQPVPIGVTVRVTPYIKGDRIAYTAQLSISELITKKTSGGQTSSEIMSRDLYVSGTPKDGEEVWFNLEQPSKGKNTVIWLRFKHKNV